MKGKWTYKGVKRFYPELSFDDCSLCRAGRHFETDAADVVAGCKSCKSKDE